MIAGSFSGDPATEKVSFGGQPARSVLPFGTEWLLAVTPPGRAGQHVHVSVEDAGRQLSSPAGSFAFTAEVSTTPIIASVRFAGRAQNLDVEIDGSGFGNATKRLPFAGDTPDLALIVYQRSFSAGYCDRPTCNGVGLNYRAWSDTRIEIAGFGAGYGAGNWRVESGDTLTILVRNPQTGQAATWSGTVP